MFNYFKAAVAAGDLDEIDNVIRHHLCLGCPQFHLQFRPRPIRQDMGVIVKKLLNHGLTVHYTRVAAAIHARSKESLGIILENGYDLNVPVGECNSTPLLYVSSSVRPAPRRPFG